METKELSDYIVKSVEGANLIASGQLEILLKNVNDFPQKLKISQYKVHQNKGWLYTGGFAGLFLKFFNALRDKHFKKRDLNNRIYNPMFGISNANTYLIELKKFYESSNDKRGLLKDIKQHLVEIYDVNFDVAYSKEFVEKKECLKFGAIGSGASIFVFSLGQLVHELNLPVQSYVIPTFWGLTCLFLVPSLKLFQVSYSANKFLKKEKEKFQKIEREKKLIKNMDLNELENLLIENEKKIKENLK